MQLDVVSALKSILAPLTDVPSCSIQIAPWGLLMHGSLWLLLVLETQTTEKKRIQWPEKKSK